MIVWRIARKKYIRDLSGEGSRMNGGRWNHKGTPMLYTSAHCSLALLEVFVNTSKENLPNDLHYLKLHIPDELKISAFKTEALPDNWKLYPAPLTLTDSGTNWCRNMESVVLQVPSVIVPQESNYLLNPRHPKFKQCTIVDESLFEVDFRIN